MTTISSEKAGAAFPLPIFEKLPEKLKKKG